MIRWKWMVAVVGVGLVVGGCVEEREAEAAQRAAAQVEAGTAANDPAPEVAAAADVDANANADDIDPAEYDFYEDWSDGINAERWLVAGWREHGVQMSPERVVVDEDGRLNITFVNDAEEGYLGGALQTQREDFRYGRWEARLKPTSVPGVLNSMYTIDWGDGDGTKQEIDIEFLTYTFDGPEHPGEVWIALHAAGRESTGFSQPLDFDPSADFHVWGWEITPEYIEWFVDDQVLYRYVYAEQDITVDAPYMLKFNVWTQEAWIHGPPTEDLETTYQIDWVRFKAREEE